jgi:hypothetical protein
MLTGWKERLANGKTIIERGRETDIMSEENNQEFEMKYLYSMNFTNHLVLLD